MLTRQIGDLTVSAIGLGAMPFSVAPAPTHEQAVATVHAALDAGVRLIDTADAYSLNQDPGHNESIVAAALAAYGGPVDDVLVATKGGHTRTPDGGWDVDGRPVHLREACAGSLKRLGVERIGLYQHHRPDPKVPYAETMGGLRELVDAGMVRMVGISNADVDQIRLAREICGDALVSVQNQLSPSFRTSEGELELCTELGLAFLPWSPLGGIGRAGGLGDSFAAFEQVAAARGVSAQQVCLAWLLSKSPVMIPIPGSSRPETARSSAAAAEVELTAEEVERLDATG